MIWLMISLLGCGGGVDAEQAGQLSKMAVVMSSDKIPNRVVPSMVIGMGGLLPSASTECMDMVKAVARASSETKQSLLAVGAPSCGVTCTSAEALSQLSGVDLGNKALADCPDAYFGMKPGELKGSATLLYLHNRAVFERLEKDLGSSDLPEVKQAWTALKAIAPKVRLGLIENGT
jgi:hypothetical protein